MLETDISSQEQLLSLTEELLLDKDLLAFECEEEAFSSFEDAPAELLLAFFEDGLEVIELLDGPISVFCRKIAFFVGFMYPATSEAVEGADNRFSVE